MIDISGPTRASFYVSASRILMMLVASTIWFMTPASAAESAAAQVVTDDVAAWNAHDANLAASYLADDVQYYDASVGEPQVGREAAKANVIEAFLNAAPDAEWVQVGAAVIDGDSVAFEWVFSGTNTGAWSDGTAATGEAFSFHGLSLFRLSGDKITYQGDYYDALGFYQQLGLM